MREQMKYLLMKLRPIQHLIVERNKLRNEVAWYRGVAPAGHYSSPIPSLDEVRLREKEIFSATLREIPGVDLNEKEQLSLLGHFTKLYDELPFKSHRTSGLRYYFDNNLYSYSDAIILYCMIRHLRPKQIIEIGCGHSSCVILDTNELFFDNSISCTFIDPHPESFRSLIKKDDERRVTLIAANLQDTDLTVFSGLDQNDILFIDSTHVSKVGSDVNRIFFDILPLLKSGVYVHFHDVFYPFEYPKEWIYQGRAWNESYLLRSFLQYNCAFRVVLFNTYLEQFHEDVFREEMPLCLKNRGGSIWIKRI